MVVPMSLIKRKQECPKYCKRIFSSDFFAHTCLFVACAELNKFYLLAPTKSAFESGLCKKNAHISAELKILSLIYRQFLRQSVANSNCFMGEAYAI